MPFWLARIEGFALGKQGAAGKFTHNPVVIPWMLPHPPCVYFLTHAGLNNSFHRILSAVGVDGADATADLRERGAMRSPPC